MTPKTDIFSFQAYLMKDNGPLASLKSTLRRNDGKRIVKLLRGKAGKPIAYLSNYQQITTFNMLKFINLENYFDHFIAISRKGSTFAPVFHGIRFKVRRLFVVMTSNFFRFMESQFNQNMIDQNIINQATAHIRKSPGFFFQKGYYFFPLIFSS